MVNYNNFFLKKIFLLFFLILLLSGIVFAILPSGEIKIFAVTEKDDGIAADLFLYTIPGKGEVAFVTSNSLVGKDTQLTGNIALNVAQKESKISASSKNFIFDIKAAASEVDGPSAGAAMALLAYSVLTEKPLNKEVGITGTINSDGSIGVVGGIGAKAVVAAKNNIKLLLIPSGQAITFVKQSDGKSRSVNLLSYGPEELGLKVVEVANIREVLKFAYSDVAEIEVDSITGTTTFIPVIIKYKPALEPMVSISSNYIERAKNAISRAEKELETSILDDSFRAVFYSQLGKAKRDVELSQIYLDQNYLYSAANYSFNAHVASETIELIAASPSLLSSDSKILDLKVNDLLGEIFLLKKEMTFFPVNNFEWLIGAQQRIAYAENALNNINIVDDSLDEQSAQFSKVNNFVSAKQWVLVAKDFFKKARQDSSFRKAFYSEDFILRVSSKIDSVDKLIENDSITDNTRAEVLRRLNSSKISFKNGFYFAALYDAFFAESFFSSEIRRNSIEGSLQEEVEFFLENSVLDSLWANLFFDHAIFFVKNAEFEESLERRIIAEAMLDTAFDLLFLSNKLEEANIEVREYLLETDLEIFVPMDNFDSSPVVEISYVEKENMVVYLSIILVCLLLILFVFVLIGIKLRNSGFASVSRAEKIGFLLNRLDKALSQKKISDAEYFFLKKKYDSEYRSLKQFCEERSKMTLTLSELKTKLSALQNGLKDLKKHYKSGLIIPEDYTKHLSEVNSEIVNIKQQINDLNEKLRATTKGNLRRAYFKSKRFDEMNVVDNADISNVDKNNIENVDNIDSIIDGNSNVCADLNVRDSIKKDKKNISKFSKSNSEFDVKGTIYVGDKNKSEFDVLGTGDKEDKDVVFKKHKKIRRKSLKKKKKIKKK